MNGVGLPGGGLVHFYDGSTEIGTATATNGAATLDMVDFTGGTHPVWVAYDGDDTFGSSTAFLGLASIAALGLTVIYSQITVWPASRHSACR